MYFPILAYVLRNVFIFNFLRGVHLFLLIPCSLLSVNYLQEVNVVVYQISAIFYNSLFSQCFLSDYGRPRESGRGRVSIPQGSPRRKSDFRIQD